MLFMNQSISFTRYLDFICSLAIARFTGGNLSIAPEAATHRHLFCISAAAMQLISYFFAEIERRDSEIGRSA